MIRKNLSKSSYILLTIVFVVLAPVRTLGWGNKGHQVVARIATARLSTNARQAIAELLGKGETLESVSTWADQIRTEPQRVKTKSWHFVAIPFTEKGYLRAKHCARNETCIIEAIGQQLAILKNIKNDSKSRAEALKFLVHLIGDLHQPFHVTTNTNPPDLAASGVRVTSLSGRSTNLFYVWDDDLVDHGLNQSAKSLNDYANQLTNRLRQDATRQSYPTEQSSFVSTQGSVTDWALEAHRLPWRAYYHTNGDFMVADPKRSWTLDRAYYDKNLPVVEGQLVRAGVRLAKVLNDAFNMKTGY